MKRLVIVGGGIAGLATAYTAQKLAREQGADVAITLVERDDRLGGKIATERTDGFVIEGGPDSFIAYKPWALQLCRELGLEDRLIGTNDAQRTNFVLRKGRLRKMPDGLMMVVPTRFMPFVTSDLISWPGKLRMGMDLFLPRRADESDESLAHFIRRRLGDEALEVLAEPLMGGIHVADAEILSLQATFPHFMAIERQYGSLTRGMIAARKAAPAHHEAQHKGGGSSSTFLTLQHGLREIVEAIESDLTGVTVLTGCAVTALTPQDGEYALRLDGDRVLSADAVVLAAPAYASADLLRTVQPDLARMLDAVKYVSTATVSLGFDAAGFEHPLDGFGFVIPRREPTRLLACTWTSTKFPQRAAPGTVLLRAFIGGPRREDLVDLDDAALVELVREELRAIMGVHAVPTVARVFRWFRANPQYEVGHLQRVDQMEALRPPGIFLAGSAYRGVGLPDCIRQGQEAARAALAYLGVDAPEAPAHYHH